MKCKKCKKEITGGFYNAPSGVHCPNCWENVPQNRKEKELKTALRRLASIGGIIS